MLKYRHETQFKLKKPDMMATLSYFAPETSARKTTLTWRSAQKITCYNQLATHIILVERHVNKKVNKVFEGRSPLGNHPDTATLDNSQ